MALRSPQTVPYVVRVWPQDDRPHVLLHDCDAMLMLGSLLQLGPTPSAQAELTLLP